MDRYLYAFAFLSSVLLLTSSTSLAAENAQGRVDPQEGRVKRLERQTEALILQVAQLEARIAELEKRLLASTPAKEPRENSTTQQKKTGEVDSQLTEVERRLAETVAKLSPAGDGPDLIESRIDGDFEGWSGETIFKLDNGQIWQQVTYSYTYRYAFRPKVFIIKVHGAYKMIVEGISQSIFVRRLK